MMPSSSVQAFALLPMQFFDVLFSLDNHNTFCFLLQIQSYYSTIFAVQS